MHSKISHLRTLLWIALTAVSLTACSGGGTLGSMGQMKLGLADSPIDGAEAVVVEFTGVELIPNAGKPVTITFSEAKRIDLLNQSGTASAVLFDQQIPAGTYGQVRLNVVADGDPSHSSITLSDGTQHGLSVPSGTQTGLKLVSGFTVPASGVVDYTIDFNLRDSVTCPPGQSPTCLLRPALRMVNDASVGNIQGSVSNTEIPSGCSPGVYLYNGTVTSPEDVNTAKTDDPNQPINSVAPVAGSTPPYYYQFTFLPPGSYTVAFTCEASSDNADTSDNGITFSPIQTGITVTAGQTTTVNIPMT